MPLSSIVEAILQPVVEIVLQVFCFGTARLLVPVLTGGMVRVEPLTSPEFVRPKGGRIRRSEPGRYVMDAELASLVGLLFWFSVAIGLYFVLST